jgi:hypothetical protein
VKITSPSSAIRDGRSRPVIEAPKKFGAYCGKLRAWHIHSETAVALNSSPDLNVRKTYIFTVKTLSPTRAQCLRSSDWDIEESEFASTAFRAL